MQYLEVLHDTYFFYADDYIGKGLNYYASNIDYWFKGESQLQFASHVQQPNPLSYLPVEETKFDTLGFQWAIIPITLGNNSRYIMRLDGTEKFHNYKSSTEQNLADNAPSNEEGFFKANSGKIIIASTLLLTLVTILLLPKNAKQIISK